MATYRDIAERYAVRPEPKSAASDGQPCTKRTRGLLQRRQVLVGGVRYVGKESNRLDDVEHGLVHSLDEVQTTYEDPSLDPFTTPKPTSQTGKRVFPDGDDLLLREVDG